MKYRVKSKKEEYIENSFKKYYYPQYKKHWWSSWKYFSIYPGENTMSLTGDCRVKYSSKREAFLAIADYVR